MNDRMKAIEILRQAREVLLARLTERVLDGREDILDDASGFSYSSAIESLHDQMGQRLGNVTALLAHLQSQDESSHYETAPAEMMTVVPEVDTVFGVDLEGYLDESVIRVTTDPARSGQPGDHDRARSRQAADTEWRIDTDERADGDDRPDTPPESQPPAKSNRQSPGSTESSAASVVSPDAGCRDHVFQDTDFRSVDLLAADFDGGVLNSADSGAEDAPAAE